MKVFENVEVGNKFFLRNLEIYPLRYIGRNGTSYLTLDEGLREGIVELKDVYDVNSIGVFNRSNMPLILLEGESLQGARQDRIFNITSIIEQEVETVLPVSCVEQGRWEGESVFSTSLTLAFPSLRSILRSSVYNSLKHSGRPESNQRAIWDEVKKTITITRTKSNTLSMHDAYHSLREEIDRYVTEWGSFKDIHGYMVFADDTLVALDLFSSAELLKKYERKLFESYAMQGVLFLYGQRDLKKVKLKPNEIGKFDDLEFEVFHGIGSGFEKRYNGDFLLGLTYNKDNEFVYASLVPSHK